MKPAEHKRIELVRVLGQMGTDRNEIPDQCARQGSSHPLTVPQPILGMSARVAMGVIRDWTSRKHEKQWQSLHGKRHTKGFLKRPSTKKKVGELLNLSRNSYT